MGDCALCMNEITGAGPYQKMSKIQVPFFRPALQEAEINEVAQTLRSGWITSGPRVQRFERDFAAVIGDNGHALHAVALNSGTAALHLAVEALQLKPGQGVLVPTMTFAATAEVVRYQGAIPILVDCEPGTLNMDLEDAARRLERAQRKTPRGKAPTRTGQGSGDPVEVVGIMPVHVGGVLMDLERVEQFAAAQKLWIVEDAAHALPSGWRRRDGSWQQRSNGSRTVTCYSFYPNKTITTGEGGMAVTSNSRLAKRMRLMSLHGLSADAWNRYSSSGKWDYKIVAPGYKYNLTDIAAAIGIHQLGRVETMRQERERIAHRYASALARVEQIELPSIAENRKDSWHLFAIKLRLNRLKITRDQFIEELTRAGVGCSVHWRPLHLHPYYRRTFGYRAKDFPVATAQWKRLISLPIFPGMRENEIEYVISVITRLCKRHAR
jgi:dTDP-4-amino-4,6-dideoxygalactose transaminase